MADTDIKAKIEKLLAKLDKQEQINIVESLGKKLRRANAIRINDGQMGRKKIDVRPDEFLMNQLLMEDE
jgi:hypothetical protein